MLQDLLISAFSGVGPYLIGATVLTTIWAVKSHYRARHTDEELCRRVRVLEDWKDKHDLDTGDVHKDITDLRLEMETRFTRIETLLDILIKKQGLDGE